jgi:hypothetical protein
MGTGTQCVAYSVPCPCQEKGSDEKNHRKDAFEGIVGRFDEGLSVFKPIKLSGCFLNRFRFELLGSGGSLAQMTHEQAKEPGRVRQFLVGAMILLVVMVGFVTLLLSWRKIPGLLGETVGKMVGIMSTPFFMEASFVILGFLIVVTLNTWRRHKEGDEFVSIETEGEPADRPDAR